jgi:hypothetical protein
VYWRRHGEERRLSTPALEIGAIQKAGQHRIAVKAAGFDMPSAGSGTSTDASQVLRFKVTLL